MRVTVIGTGYLGVTHAASMAELGHDVLGIDTDPEKVAALSAGRVPFHEPGLDDLVRRHVESGALRFTTSYEDVARFGAGGTAVHFLCVGTPQRNDGQAADLGFLDSAVEGLGPHLTERCLVVGKSTVPVGSADRLAGRIEALAPAGRAVEVAWNPEFLREGSAIRDTLTPDRLVIGVESPWAEEVLREVYTSTLERDVPLVVTSRPTAELIKISANAFLATKISFINAMAEVCEAAGADVVHLARALSHDVRIGGAGLAPGVGFGGGCLAKDIRAFTAQAGELGLPGIAAFLDEVDAINLRRRVRMADLARQECGGDVLGKRIAVWGAAFKPNSDDIRDSPALDVAAALHDAGAQVTVYDPMAMDKVRKQFPLLRYAETAVDAAIGAHVVLHLTEWEEFRALDPARVGAVVASRRVIDGRNALNAGRWRAAGWMYCSPGRPQPIPC